MQFLQTFSTPFYSLNVSNNDNAKETTDLCVIHSTFAMSSFDAISVFFVYNLSYITNVTNGKKHWMQNDSRLE